MKNKTKMKIIKITKITSIAFIATTFLLVASVYAMNQYYRINNGQNMQINVFGSCTKVTNSSGISYFIPTNSNNEWVNFKNNKPVGVSLGSCWPVWKPLQVGSSPYKNPYTGFIGYSFPIAGKGANCQNFTVAGFPTERTRYTQYIEYYNHGLYYITTSGVKPLGVTTITAYACVYQGGQVKWKLLGP